MTARTITLAFTGASGMPYGLRLLECLPAAQARAGRVRQLRLAQAGAIVLPPVPGFHDRPQSVADLVDFIVARVLDQLKVPHALGPRWGSRRVAPDSASA